MNETGLTNAAGESMSGAESALAITHGVEDGGPRNYHSLFEQATDAIMVTDFQGNFLDVNSSFCTLFGYEKAALLSMNIKSLLDPEHYQEKPIRFDLLAIGENIFNERKMVHKNGTVIHVEANAKKLCDKSVLAIARDITERKKVATALQQSEVNLKTIFDTTDTIYVLMDNDFRVISYNRRACDFASKELGHTIKTSEFFLDYFPEEKHSVINMYMKTVLTGRPVNYEASYLQPDGSYNWYHVRMFPIPNGDDTIHGLMVAVSNITEKKLLQQELLDQKVQEQKRITRAVINAQEKERAEIGAELHDNINQLLATSLLYMKGSLKENDKVFFISKGQEFVEDAMEELRKLSHVLVGPTQNTSMGLVISLEELINNISITKDIQINFDYTDYREDDFEAGLKLVIYRIIQEQISNILKYAEASLVEITLKKEGEFLIVHIHDNGKGFDTSVKSTGIGLNNISHRAAVYNGVMRLVSSPGNGCKMKIIFKLNN